MSATRSGRGTLARELVLLAGLIALVAVLLTGAAAWYTARSGAEAQEREQLGRQATVLSRVPRLSGLLVEGGQLIAGSNGVRLAVLDPSGTLHGPAAAAVSNAQRDVLLAREPLSATGTLDGRPVVLEGRVHGAGGVVLAKPMAEVDAATARIRRNLLLPLCAGLAGAVVAGLLLARRISRPLVRAAASARRLAAGRRGIADPGGYAGPGAAQDVGPDAVARPGGGAQPSGGPGGRPGAGPAPGGRPAATGPAEVVELAEAMAVLERALVRSEARQREFLLSVSHEIRTPLTTMRGYAEALADGVIPVERVPETGRVLDAEARRLDRFLSDLLDLARLEADEFRFEPAETDLVALLEQAAGSWRERCARHEVEFRWEPPAAGGPLTARTDGFRVRQLADCLLANALRLTPAGAPVVLALAALPGGGARVEVRDGGPGLTEDDVTVAFERGALYARYRGERPVGSGLGLAIAHRLATRLGGTLGALGHGPEGGAVFTLVLPPAGTVPHGHPRDEPSPMTAGPTGLQEGSRGNR
ncbi:HAMP domain-containing sensor histidine kinase [Streptomyces sp. NRRL S-87]|uniref:sensor histidine kinase n=1 Tax=Streptomyces sp. NRRL S-87 TaxID=1463920 RepID=UPI0007C4F1A7|nr:HAMP domain-containing sensor histidine kinase [Streptomyces sp. NRRL S-87]